MTRLAVFVLIVSAACSKKQHDAPTAGSATRVAAPVASDAASDAPAVDLTGAYGVNEFTAFSIVAGPQKTLIYYEDAWREEGFACECVSELKHVEGDRYAATAVDDSGLTGEIKIHDGEITGERFLDEMNKCCDPSWPGLHIYPKPPEALAKCKAKPEGVDEHGWKAGDEVEAAVSHTKTTVARFHKGNEVVVEKVAAELLDCPKRERK